MEQIRRSTGVPARATSTTTPLPTNHNAASGHALRRRRAAAERLPILDCGFADPWSARCRRGDSPTVAEVDGYAAAVRLLDGLGLTPAPLLPELRALWRQGDRAAVASVTTRWLVA
jgi:hypothetical protein